MSALQQYSRRRWRVNVFLSQRCCFLSNR